ncbi:MAG: S-layer homology domain-containing protein [Clostridia bacterium]|nr:S-layer homology domain-containing protein [Clostridia bacterium]
MKKIIAITLVACLLLSVSTVVFASETLKQTFTTKSVEGEIVVPVTVTEGKWGESATMKNYDGSPHKWTATNGASMTFSFEDVKAGKYELFYWTLPHVNNKVYIDFIVNHNGKQDVARIYQKLDEGEEQAPGWVSMGVYDFAGTGVENVYYELKDGSNIRATSVKLVPSTKEVTVNPLTQEEKIEPEKTETKSTLLDSIDVEPQGTCYYGDEWGESGSVTGPMVKYPKTLWAANGDKSITLDYKPQLSAVGDVRVSVYLLYWHENQNPQVKYEVYHNGKVDTVVLDPTSISKSQWVTLGTYDFAGKPDEEYVKLVCVPTTIEKANTRASTVAFEILNTERADVWQTVYVTPKNDSGSLLEAAKGSMAALNKFSDITDHWAKYDVEFMANEGLISGVSDNAFDPEAQITRAEYVTILDRAMGYEMISGESFSDVGADEWFAPYVATAKANGLLTGLPTDDGFKPNQPITREEMALFTYNAIMKIGKNDEWLTDMPDIYSQFKDTDSVSDWAEEALKYLIKTGIIKGTSDTTVSATDNATRAQGAVILKRFMQMFVWAGPPTDEEWKLTFNDEFFGDSVNWDVWKSDASAPGHIMSSRWPENLEVHDGNLYLVNRRENRGGKEWTSASVWVKPEVFRQSYGYWEARYKISGASGVNNSFWMITNSKQVTDPKQQFELDVNEGHYPNKVNTNYHSWYTGDRIQHSESYKSQYDLSKDYHTYALEWNPDKLIYYFDGKVISEKKNENASIPLFPYFSTAIINWGGAPDDNTDGSAQVVDYVRIWQRATDVNDPEKTVYNQPLPESETKTEEKKTDIPVVSIADQKTDNEKQNGEIIIHPVVDESLWGKSPTIPNYDGKSHYWLKKPGEEALFPLDNVKNGMYKVYYWRIPHTVNAPQADIYLRQEDKDVLVGSAAMRISEGESFEPGWILINEGIEIKDAKGAAMVYKCTPDGTGRASGIKLVPVK